MIYVYNCKEEDHTQEPNNFYIGRSRNDNPLGNPFGVAGKRPSLAKMTFPTRDEAIDAYKLYEKSPRKPTAFRRGMNWGNYYFLIIFQFVAIFIVIYNNKYCLKYDFIQV